METSVPADGLFAAQTHLTDTQMNTLDKFHWSEHLLFQLFTFNQIKNARVEPGLNRTKDRYLYLLSTTMLYHRVLANTTNCSSTAQHVALCRRVKGLRGGLSHSDSHM